MKNKKTNHQYMTIKETYIKIKDIKESDIKKETYQTLYSKFNEIFKNTLYLQQARKQIATIKILCIKLKNLKKIKKYSRETIRKLYIVKKLIIMQIYIHSYLQKKSTTKTKIIYAYLTNHNIGDISKKFRHKPIDIIDILNRWATEGFNSIYKKKQGEIIVKKRVSEKERIERSLIGRINTKKAKAILLIKQKKFSKIHIANKLFISRQTLYLWEIAYEKYGISSLKEKRHRKTILLENDIEIIVQILNQYPTSFKTAYQEIVKKTNKTFTSKTLRNFIKRKNL